MTVFYGGNAIFTIDGVEYGQFDHVEYVAMPSRECERDYRLPTEFTLTFSNVTFGPGWPRFMLDLLYPIPTYPLLPART